MIRYVLTFKEPIRMEQVSYFRDMLKEAADDRQYRDIVLTNGATLEDMRRRSPTPAFVRRARSRGR